MSHLPARTLEERILATLAYAGLFGAGLTESELTQRLLGSGPAPREAMHTALAAMNGRTGRLARRGEAWVLAGSAMRPATPLPDLGPVRAWAAAAAAIPFVRFIGLTGALAKGAPDADMDLFVVAASGRGYLVFALLKTIGRLLAARHGLRLCLNFLVEEESLAVGPHDAFTATEFVTMVPLLDDGVQSRLWAANAGWIALLCGAAQSPGPGPGPSGISGRLRRAGEAVLRGGFGDRLNRLSHAAKRRRLVRLVGTAASKNPNIVVEPGYFKQHTVDHRAVILGRFAERLRELGQDPAWVTAVLP